MPKLPLQFPPVREQFASAIKAVALFAGCPEEEAACFNSFSEDAKRDGNLLKLKARPTPQTKESEAPR
jgi:hypothetical protein